jgi:26S proteasome regulatory subunit N9
VEWLVMKAFALGLIRGTIDQVQEVVYIQWIQPRVLSIEQVQKMKERMNTWTNEIKSMFSVCPTKHKISVRFLLLSTDLSNRKFVFLQSC